MMFGLSKKERATEALQRATSAILIGGFFHAEDADEYGLNEQASAYFYTESLVHQIYILVLIFNNTVGKAQAWAEPAFAWKVVNQVITDYEIQQGGTLGSMTPFIFRRCVEIDELSPEERGDGEEFRQSARKVAELDSSADQASIADLFSGVSRKCFDSTIDMFR